MPLVEDALVEAMHDAKKHHPDCVMLCSPIKHFSLIRRLAKVKGPNLEVLPVAVVIKKKATSAECFRTLADTPDWIGQKVFIVEDIHTEHSAEIYLAIKNFIGNDVALPFGLVNSVCDQKTPRQNALIAHFAKDVCMFSGCDPNKNKTTYELWCQRVARDFCYAKAFCYIPRQAHMPWDVGNLYESWNISEMKIPYSGLVFLGEVPNISSVMSEDLFYRCQDGLFQALQYECGGARYGHCVEIGSSIFYSRIRNMEKTLLVGCPVSCGKEGDFGAFRLSLQEVMRPVVQCLKKRIGVECMHLVLLGHNMVFQGGGWYPVASTLQGKMAIIEEINLLLPRTSKSLEAEALPLSSVTP